MSETKQGPLAWEQFLKSCDRAESAQRNRPCLDLRSNMDTEEIWEKSQVLQFFQNRELDPQIKMALSDAMEKLPLIQGTALRAIFWQGLSIAEVAKELKTTDANIRKAKSRALKKLQQIFASKKWGVTFRPRESSVILEG